MKTIRIAGFLALAGIAAALLGTQAARTQSTPPALADTDLPGGDFLSIDLPENSAVACMRYCAGHDRCMAYTYVPGGGTPGGFETARCWLKDRVPAGVGRSGMTSGVKGVNFTRYAAQADAERTTYALNADTAAKVGWRSMPAEGTIPMLAIIADISPPAGSAATCRNGGPLLSNQVARVEQVMFGAGSNATGDSSVSRFYNQASRGHLVIARAGVVGPVKICPDATDVTERAVRVADASGFNFAPYDRNGDYVIRPDELMIVGFDNVSPSGGAKRDDCYDSDDRSPDGHVIRVCSSAGVGCNSIMINPAHESGHLIGGADLYGVWGNSCWSQNLTLMSCTASPWFRPGNDSAVNFDPWHRMAFGWARPLFARTTDDTRFLMSAYSDAPSANEPDQPVIIYDTRRGFNEFYMAELRDGRRAYDRSLPVTPFVMLWYVQTDGTTGRLKGQLGRIGTGRGDNVLDTTVMGDDITLDTDGDRVADTILAGANGVVDSVPDARDGAAYYAMDYATIAPRGNGGPGAPMFLQPWNGPARLAWFDGTDAQVEVSVSQDASGQYVLRVANSRPRPVTALQGKVPLIVPYVRPSPLPEGAVEVPRPPAPVPPVKVLPFQKNKAGG